MSTIHNRKSKNTSESTSSSDTQVKKTISLFTSNPEIGKEDLLINVYWIRQIVAIFFGLVWGVLCFEGFISIVVYGLVSSLVTYLYCSKFMGIEAEDAANVDVLGEGFMPSNALFLIVWICTYSNVKF